MLTPDEFEEWCKYHELPELSRATLKHIRSVEPARRVGGGRKNVSGFYPSKKMGKSIQFESHKVELPFIYELEHDEDVKEFYDQPPAFKINYKSASGKNLGFFYTPDFFVIRTNSAGWVECKTERELQKLVIKQPHRYSQGEDGHWHTPPASFYAAQFGFDFKIFSDKQINWILYRNLTFLEDYYRSSANTINTFAMETIQKIVSDSPGITLERLIDNIRNISDSKPGAEISVDSIYFLIATEQIYVDLKTTVLVESSKCQVFSDEQRANAYLMMVSSLSTNEPISSTVINLVPNMLFNWDGLIYTLVQVGQTEVILRSTKEQLVDLPLSEFENKIRNLKIILIKTQEFNSSSEQVNSISEQVKSIFSKASSKDLLLANYRYRIIEPILLGQTKENTTVPKRTIRYWLAKYRQAQKLYSYGYVGLLNCSSKKGNRNRKLPPQILELMDSFITKDYENHKQKRKYEVYGAFCNACSLVGITDDQIPSYKTFINEIKKRSGWEQTYHREGHRAAYSQKSFYWELELTTPRHGDRPFEIGHIDHTKMDIELRCSQTGQILGRPWATFLVDAYSRRILAVYLTFDPPSYRSCMMVLRICVMRYSRLPQIIVTDNGKEFHSTYFESLLALFECTLKHRPPAASRFSGVCERLFGTANTQFLYNLAGNTQITKKVRLMTKSVDPKNLAVWTLGMLYLYLCEWAYSEYDTTEHPTLGMSPYTAFNQGIANYGNRAHRLIPNDENWRILTLPTTPSVLVKVHPTQGIQIRGIHYWNSVFRDPNIHKTYVEIRYDPFDISIAYAYVRGQWVECVSEYYAIFKGRSEKEIWLATSELRKQKSNHQKELKVRAKKLAEFLSTAEAEEVLLAQRLRDAQGKEVWGVVDFEQNQELNCPESVIVVDQNTHLESELPTDAISSPISTTLQLFESY
jgi:transposase InsO family protein